LWSILFLLVPVLGVACFVLPAMGWPANHWLPRDISEQGYVIDGLFYFILWLTGAIFIATGAVLAWFLFRYDAETNSDPTEFTHGSHTLEVIWSIIPAATLLFIAIYQMPEWYNTKLGRPNVPPLAEVTGRQFEWRIRYAGEDQIVGTRDDIFTVNDLYVPRGEEVVLVIKSQDVLHSFFLPNLRVKQDVVPGMQQAVWFKAQETGSFDIVCAELCGWGHYKMKGRITVLERPEYEAQLALMRRQQEESAFKAPIIKAEEAAE
jgi:cytochrome c oxidase subunit 2